MSRALVSIVVPTRNGADTLPALLDAVRAQHSSLPREVIVVDSGSTDGTLDLLRTAADRVIEIDSSRFNHGATRNLAIEAAAGDIVVLLVQDAVPEGPDWLTNLVAPLLADESLAGVYARQVPRPQASAVTRHYLSSWAACSETPRHQPPVSAEEWARLSPPQRFERCVFDNVCSAVRRSVWQAHPFAAVPLGEDVEWARAVLLAGHRLAYVPAAAVVHSHDRGPRYEFRRTYLVHAQLWRLFGLATIPDVASLLRSIAGSLAVHLRCVARDGRRSFREVVRSVALAFAFPLGQYLGARAGATGQPLRSRGV